MTSSSTRVKRSYDASRRRERASRRHAVTLDAARRLLFANGYTATTVEEIAEAAGVSAATIYKTYGGKKGLVRALCQQALEGEGPIPAEERSNALRAQEDGRRVIEGWGRLAAEVAPRIAPLLLLLRDAALLDSESANLLADITGSRLERMSDNARFLAEKSYLRAEITIEEARDILWFYTSPEVFDLLVNQRGWTPDRFGKHIAEGIRTALA